MLTEGEYFQALDEMRTALIEERARSAKMARGQISMFKSKEDENLVKYQLDLKEELDRIYHLLRGDKLVEDEEGNLLWTEEKKEELKPFNEFGVQLIMNIMSFYLNRNTLLSNYDEETINWKVLDFGFEISDLIHNRYKEMGMDNMHKQKMYPMIVRELVDTVHSAYLRALNGGERESLRTARTVTQTDPLNVMPNFGGIQSNKPKHWYNPFTWGR